MRAGLLASTVTPGRTAPDSSFTCPVTTACADATRGKRTTPTRATRIALPKTRCIRNLLGNNVLGRRRLWILYWPQRLYHETVCEIGGFARDLPLKQA